MIRSRGGEKFCGDTGEDIQKRLRYSKPDHLKCAEYIGKILAEE